MGPQCHELLKEKLIALFYQFFNQSHMLVNLDKITYAIQAMHTSEKLSIVENTFYFDKSQVQDFEERRKVF